MPQHAAVTGLGAVTPLGATVSDTWEALRATDSGITSLSRFDPAETGLRSSIAGEVTTDPTDRSVIDSRAMGRYAQFAVLAAQEALLDATLAPDRDAWTAERVGVSIASGLGGFPEIEATITGDRVSPRFTIRYLSNLAAGHVSQTFDARGPNRAPATACAAGTHAIADALADIQTGRADIMIAGGAEAPLSPTAMRGFDAMRALSTNTEVPAQASRPFDAARDGFVMAEGAGIMILESPAHATARGVTPVARLTGAARTADAHHPTQPPDDAHGLRRCLRQALADANCAPTAVDHINAHGTGTPQGDAHEATAIRHVFNSPPPVTGIKSLTGHSLGACGAIEAVTAAKAAATGYRPPTANYDTPDPACDLPIITSPQPITESAIVSTSAGFGGTNGALVIETNAE